MKARTYYIIFGRPPIGGKLPPSPPWRRHCPTHSFVSGQVKRHSTPSLAHLINTSHRPRTLRAVEFLYDVRRLFQRRIPLTQSRVSHCLRCDFCQSVRGCRQDATQRTREERNKHTHTHTYTRLTALFPGLLGWAGTRKVNQSGFYWSKRQWAICKSAPCSRQIATPAPHHSVFYRPGALPAAQPTASKHWRQGRK